MSESLIIFSREWTVTAALALLLAPQPHRQVTAVYDLAQLTSLFGGNRVRRLFWVCGRMNMWRTCIGLSLCWAAGWWYLWAAVFTGRTTVCRSGWDWGGTGFVHGTQCRIRSPGGWSCGIPDSFPLIHKRATAIRKMSGKLSLIPR